MLAVTEKAPENELLIEREFEAPRALVWRIWSDAEHLKRWFGPTGFTCPVFDLDFRVGGRYRAVIRSDEHGEYWFGGTFREIRPDARIVMSFMWEEDAQETTITVTLTERDGKTVQSFHQTPFASVESRDGHLEGWVECLEKGRAYAEDLAGSTES